jgi:hypothetical protein
MRRRRMRSRSSPPSSTALHCTALHCTALHCTALHCTALHCTSAQRTALHCSALHCTALQRTPRTRAAHCTVAATKGGCSASNAPPEREPYRAVVAPWVGLADVSQPAWYSGMDLACSGRGRGGGGIPWAERHEIRGEEESGDRRRRAHAQDAVDQLLTAQSTHPPISTRRLVGSSGATIHGRTVSGADGRRSGATDAERSSAEQCRAVNRTEPVS